MDILIICAQCVRVCIKTSDKLSRAFSYQLICVSSFGVRNACCRFTYNVYFCLQGGNESEFTTDDEVELE